MREEVVHEEPILRQAFAGNLHIACWYDAPALEQMRAYGRCAEQLQRIRPGGTGLINLMLAGVPRFSAEVREEVAEHTRKGIHRVGAAHVVLVGGLVGTSVRAFLSTAMLIGRPKNPTKVFGTLGEASQWMSDRCRDAGEMRWDAREIRDMCQRLIELGPPRAR